jgi:hypothetical protein
LRVRALCVGNRHGNGESSVSLGGAVTNLQTRFAPSKQ